MQRAAWRRGRPSDPETEGTMNAESPQSGEWVHVGDVLIDTGRLAAHLLARSGWHP